ncbi:MAG: hypothetical protein RIA69_09165 [Cyclobacteriaceae bacterium]
MGFLKKIKNYITGGAAKVDVVFENNKVQSTSPVRCFVTAEASQNCNISKVYVEFKGEEMYLATEETTDSDSDGNMISSTSDRKSYEPVHYEKKIAAKKTHLKVGESEKWLVSFNFPEEVIPTYHGKNAHFKWLVRAGLDMAGIDPKSKWTEVIVEKEFIF